MARVARLNYTVEEGVHHLFSRTVVESHFSDSEERHTFKGHSRILSYFIVTRKWTHYS